MRHLFSLLWALAFGTLCLAQPCSTTNGTNCICPDGSTNCDLLPDIVISWFGMIDDYPTEYSQTGNGADDGRLRITGSTPNLGFGSFTVLGTDYFICGTDTIFDPTRSITTCPDGSEPTNLLVQRIYHKNGNAMTYTDRWAGGQTYHPTHHHNHVDDWVTFTLRREDPNQPDTLQWPIIGSGAKIGFCLMDLSNCNASPGHCRDDHHYNRGNILSSSSFPNFGHGGGSYNCSPIEQGISSGYVDIYSQMLDGMWIDIPPGTCNGDYWIVAQVDPRNNFLESNENNNWTAMPVTLTKQVPHGGATANVSVSPSPYLCNGSNVTLTATWADTYRWSTNETTQSIIVTQPGDYYVTVSSSCGTATSSAVTISAYTVADPVATHDTACLGGVATVSATGSGSLVWFDGPTGNNILHIGNSYTTQNITQPQTLYVQSVDTIPGTWHTCASGLVAANITIEQTVPLVFAGLGLAYLDTDAPVEIVPSVPNGTFSGRGINTDGNGRTYFSPSRSGTGDSIAITYRYTTPQGCAADTVVYVTVLHDPGSGMAELAGARLLFYPNPAQHTLTIILPTAPGISILSVLDATGKKALEMPVEGNNGRLVLDVSMLSKGIYFLRLDGMDGARFGKLSKL